MLPQTIQDAFNKQINAELFSSYLYLSMGSWFDSQNLNGAAGWMRQQAQEELQHALKFYDFVLERGGRALLSQIDAPKTEWASPLKAFEDSYSHECMVTSLINDLMNLSIKENDHAATAFLQWFITEQVEEEATVDAIVGKLKLVGDNPAALLMLDAQLAQRTAEAAPA
ncbi:MAG: ferritin [Phycisphaerales bacterium]|nr:ferritin [Phycisphaerales bacterium]